jgi:hypothetical protein
MKLKPNAVPTVFDASSSQPSKRRRVQSNVVNVSNSVNAVKGEPIFVHDYLNSNYQFIFRLIVQS